MNISLQKTLISFRNSLSVIDYNLSTLDNSLAAPIIIFMIQDMNQLGYTYSVNAIKTLLKMSNSDLQTFHEKTMNLLLSILGGNVKYVPLYKGFPKAIPNNKWSYYVESYDGYYHILHYYLFSSWDSTQYNGDWFGRQFPGINTIDAIDHPELVCKKQLKVLDISANDNLLIEVYQNLISANGSLSSDSKEYIKTFINTYCHSSNFCIPSSAEIPNKENLAFLIHSVYERYGMSAHVAKTFLPYVKTATDILRIAQAFSGGDVSLATHTKFKLTNSQRRFIFVALNSLNYKSATEDMLRFKSLWLILGKYLHIHAYESKYPNATKMIHSLRNDSKNIETFNRSVESLLILTNFSDKKEVANIVTVLKTRPGDYARRLDHLLRLTTNIQINDFIIDGFLSVADKVATPLLLNLSTHFRYRNTASEVRVFCPKGNTTNATVLVGETRHLLDVSLCLKISNNIDSLLVNRFSKLQSLGNVFIDSNLADILVPTSMRDSSSAVKVAARGSKFPISSDAKVVRLFLHWRDIEHERVDIDLSLQMLDDDFKNNGVVSYYNLSNSAITHSGDFTSAPNGAAEFIDINFDKMKKSYPDVKYVAVTINSFSGQPFNKITALGGYMERDENSGKYFEVKTVEQKYNITASTKFAIPMILDIDNRKVIWMDAGFKDLNTCTNIGSKGADLSSFAKYAVNMYREKANLYDLLMLHFEKRASNISYIFNENMKYDNIFDMSFATKIDEIMNKYLIS